jgi:hypothetical protein
MSEFTCDEAHGCWFIKGHSCPHQYELCMEEYEVSCVRDQDGVGYHTMTNCGRFKGHSGPHGKGEDN